MDTTTKILQAGIEVFSHQGYLGASTKEIAQVAGVSEMTLFRKFQTKRNLFETILKTTLGDDFADGIELAPASSKDAWVQQLLDHRLTIVSRHIDLVRMVIQESIQGRIPDEFNHVLNMKRSLRTALNRGNQERGALVDVMVGVLLHYAILTPELKYHERSPSEREQLLSGYLSYIRT